MVNYDLREAEEEEEEEEEEAGVQWQREWVRAGVASRRRPTPTLVLMLCPITFKRWSFPLRFIPSASRAKLCQVSIRPVFTKRATKFVFSNSIFEKKKLKIDDNGRRQIGPHRTVLEVLVVSGALKLR
ncbi:hypothetical protein TcasGA2_TC012826 [Tribolium castaneum]|uniref:Uncharacterized protein n=1 Tax=Tribolium castaneum TaxID=7070 RepID=D6X0X3_TRICA|nr:hypothetical protein TcasGA2_TC012826 [Tribolium castaneum]